MKEEMSKEQTPITAEEWLIKNDYHNLLITSDAMEQYAQAKVLEALEMEIPKAINFYRESKYSEDEIKCYYETEVKPKYK